MKHKNYLRKFITKPKHPHYTICDVSSHVNHEQYENHTNVLELSQIHSLWRQEDTTNTVHWSIYMKLETCGHEEAENTEN